MANDISTIPGILKALPLYKYNPAAIQRISLAHLRAVTDGKVEIVDPTNPFVFCMESSAVNTAAFLTENEANTRKQYAAVAQTAEDLYIHMSDKDYINRFSSPASTFFSILIQKSDLLQKMVYDPETLGSKVTIPRNSEFTIADTTFSLQYPIDIKQLVHGGLQVVYDTTEESPLQILTSNVITFETRTDPSLVEWIYFEFEVYQFKVNSTVGALTTVTGFNRAITITDEYYYARVFYKNTANGTWVEIKTTHTDQVYDPTAPTAVLKLIDKTLNVMIPQIYLTNNSIQGTLRIDVYETKGSINMAMENYKANAFVSTWRNIDKSNDSEYTAVMSTLSTLAYSTKVANGGSPPLTFDQLRNRVINNATGSINIPITNVQIVSALEKKGYTVVRDVDIVTNRAFLATRSLPKPIDEKLITAGASSIETFITSIRQAVAVDGVRDNGLRATLTPDIIYKNDHGIINVFPKSSLTTLLASTADEIALNVTNNKYLYTPFHYVLDTTNSVFEIRPYYLDGPITKSVRFISQNDTTGLQINTDTYVIVRTATGYKLSIVTRSNDVIKALGDNAVNVQLSYVPKGEDARAYLNGTLAGRTASNERRFEFDLSTNFDVDSNDNLVMQKFLMFNNEPRLTATNLLNEFDILYSTTAIMPSNWQVSSVDTLLGRVSLPNESVAITQEKLKILFGYPLKNLWARSRSVVSSPEFQKHTTNVQWFYEADVYLLDPVTGARFSIVNNQIVYNKLHSAGDPILDNLNQPTYKFRTGDIVLDSSGNPTPLDEAQVARQIDMLFIEGAYHFANDNAAATYRKSIVDTLVTWITVDLDVLGDNLLEQTRLYFYPKTTMGNINVLTDGGLLTAIEAGQYFTADLFVSNAVYQNTALRESLKRITISVIDSVLQRPVVSTSDIIALLKEKYGIDVISFSIRGLGGARNLSTLTVANTGNRCNIRKRLFKQPDNKLIVEEDVTVNFIKHQLK